MSSQQMLPIKRMTWMLMIQIVMKSTLQRLRSWQTCLITALIIRHRVLKELKNDDKASTSYEPSLEIKTLKHTLSEHLKEKESLEQKITLLKNDFQKEESRNIDRELALEKQVKELNNIVFKRSQSAKTVHMLTKPQVFYNHSTREALSFQNPCYLKKAQQLKPKLYDGRMIEKSNAVVIPDTKETLMLAEERKVMVITALKEQLNKLTSKAVLTKAVSLNPIDPELLKVDVAPLVLKLRKNRTAHTDYIRHTQEEAATLREIVERVILVSSASGSMSQDNTKKNRIRRTQRKVKKNKIEDRLRTVKSTLNKKSVVDSKTTSSVINSVSNVNSDLKCASCNGCLFSDNHDACVVAYIKYVNARNVCPLTRIATTTIVLPREPIPIVNSTDKSVVTLVYTRKTKAANKKVPNKMEPNNSWGSSSSNVPSPFITCRLSKSSSGTWTPVAQSI
nr:hypothetical protein [Tanacetum cinerariifolium]